MQSADCQFGAVAPCSGDLRVPREKVRHGHARRGGNALAAHNLSQMFAERHQRDACCATKLRLFDPAHPDGEQK